MNLLSKVGISSVTVLAFPASSVVLKVFLGRKGIEEACDNVNAWLLIRVGVVTFKTGIRSKACLSAASIRLRIRL